MSRPLVVGSASLYVGNSPKVVLSRFPDACFESCVTDPPYELNFMGRGWDRSGVAFDPETWRAVFRVLKPGGHLVAFGGTRTYHRMVCAIEDAGFEIRDGLQWLYGSGFPKSLDVSKALDKALGAKRVQVPPRSVIGHQRNIGNRRPYMDDPNHTTDSDVPVTDAARQWEGWGTALKPSNEPICLARKPLSGTVAENVLQYGTGALNIDGCRVEGEKGVPASLSNAGGLGWRTGGDMERKAVQNGRWPANVLLGCACEEEHEPGCAVRLVDDQSGTLTSGTNAVRSREGYFGAGNARNGGLGKAGDVQTTYGDTGGASRFFYTAKAARSERDAGIRDFAPLYFPRARSLRKRLQQDLSGRWLDRCANKHPTVKPVDLMRWLVRLVTPAGGTVLDPFGGSGTTPVACEHEGFRSVAVDLSPYHVGITACRVAHAVRAAAEERQRAEKEARRQAEIAAQGSLLDEMVA